MDAGQRLMNVGLNTAAGATLLGAAGAGVPQIFNENPDKIYKAQEIYDATGVNVAPPGKVPVNRAARIRAERAKAVREGRTFPQRLKRAVDPITSTLEIGAEDVNNYVVNPEKVIEEIPVEPRPPETDTVRKIKTRKSKKTTPPSPPPVDTPEVDTPEVYMSTKKPAISADIEAEYDKLLKEKKAKEAKEVAKKVKKTKTGEQAATAVNDVKERTPSKLKNIFSNGLDLSPRQKRGLGKVGLGLAGAVGILGGGSLLANSINKKRQQDELDRQTRLYAPTPIPPTNYPPMY